MPMAGWAEDLNKPRLTKDKWNVAIIVHDNVELLDFAGPGEVFAAAAGRRAFRVYTVAETDRPIRSQRFLTIAPQFTLTNCPKPDIVVIPGGDTNLLLRSPTIMAWVRATAKDAEVMFSVCTGAFVLADAGLLDGLEATTHASSMPGLKEYSRIKVRENRRVIDNGKIVTSAGVSAGIDGALHLVSRLCGLETAKATAKYMEYRWEPEPASPTTNASIPPDVSAAHLWFAGSWSEAEKAYKKILSQQPKDGVALYRLGFCQFQNRHFEEAMNSLEQALQNGRRNAETLLLLGSTQIRLKHYTAAARSYTDAVKLGSKEPIIQYDLSRIYAVTGQKDAALAALEQAFQEGIDNAERALIDPDLENLRLDKRFREVLRKYNYHSKVTMVTEKEDGDPLIVSGVVRSADGTPVPGAIVYVYHTDAHGRYSAKETGGAANPRLFAYLRSSNDGSYEFRTIRPGGYPDSKIPQHIHYEVMAPGHRNFEGEILLADDPRLKDEKRIRAEQNRAVVLVKREKGGVQRCTFDVTLIPE